MKTVSLQLKQSPPTIKIESRIPVGVLMVVIQDLNDELMIILNAVEKLMEAKVVLQDRSFMRALLDIKIAARKLSEKHRMLTEFVKVRGGKALAVTVEEIVRRSYEERE